MNRFWPIIRALLLLPVLVVLIFLDPVISKTLYGREYYSYWLEVKKNCRRVARLYTTDMWRE